MATPNEILRKYLDKQGITASDWLEISKPTSELEHDPFLIKDSRHWLNQLYKHRHDVITIVGDYDTDGILASTTMRSGLELLELGSKINVYVPTRMDGYGITPTSVQRIKEQFPDTQTVVTVDNGISAFDGISSAKANGWTVLVTDHHLTKGSDLPIADAIVDINRVDDTYPFKSISGTAMAYKMLLAYATKLAPKKINALKRLKLLVGISTVSDMMSLRDENRYWVRYAIHEVQNYVDGVSSPDDNKQIKALVRALISTNNLWDKHVNADTFGFTISPILNSPSRVTGTPQQAYDYFAEQDFSKLITKATDLISTNSNRKSIIGNETIKATTQVAKDLATDNSFASMVVKVPLTAGFVGLIAGNLSRDFNKPSVVFGTKEFDGKIAKDEDILHGSARSPKGLSIVAILTEINQLNSDVLVSFGGHAGAGGLAIKAKDFELFKSLFARVIDQMIAKGAEIIDDSTAIEIDSDDVTPQLINAINVMSPFGIDFPKPEFIIHDVNKNVSKMGKDKQHVKFAILDNFDIIDWNGSEHYDEHEDETLTCQGSIDFGKEFRGRVPIQMIVNKWL